jgi:hypothetical protein
VSDLRKRTQEIGEEYRETRVGMTERVCVAQLCLALARAERAQIDAYQQGFRDGLEETKGR